MPLFSSLQQMLNRYSFDNRRFWDTRYKEDPEKGSGPGSRGTFLSPEHPVWIVTDVIDDDVLGVAGNQI